MSKEEMENEVVEETTEVKEETPKIEQVEEKTKQRSKEEAIDDEFLDKKTRKDLSEKGVISRVINVLLWVILIAWMGICIWDFVNVKTDKEPIFCISKKTIKYDDGEVETCTGPGYKVFNYKRESFKGREFGPFWKKDRTAENK